MVSIDISDMTVFNSSEYKQISTQCRFITYENKLSTAEKGILNILNVIPKYFMRELIVVKKEGEHTCQ